MTKLEDFESSTRFAFEESPRSRCCFYLPCFRSHPTALMALPAGSSPPASAVPSFWQRILMAQSENRWWKRPIRALMKLREWSELVAGPKWKTFIRRFNRNRGGYCAGGVIGGGGGPMHVNFQYDSLSYALNFDEGQNRQTDEDFGYHYPDFTSRYVSGSHPSMHLMNTGRVAAPVAG